MKETAGSTTSEYTYIWGDAYSSPAVAVTSGGTTTYYYLLRDYLGNITHKVNTLNTVVAEYSFDAWGRRRNPTDWSYDLRSGQPNLFAGRGFTGHEVSTRSAGNLSRSHMPSSAFAGEKALATRGRQTKTIQRRIEQS